MTKISVPLPANEELLPIARQFDLRLIVLFGSVARGSANGESDVDLGVLASSTLSENARLKLWSELSSLFSVDVDLTILNHANPIVAYRVACEGKILFENAPSDWEIWKSYMVRHYWDTAKFRDGLNNYLARRVEGMRHVIAE